MYLIIHYSLCIFPEVFLEMILYFGNTVKGAWKESDFKFCEDISPLIQEASSFLKPNGGESLVFKPPWGLSLHCFDLDD